jgi:hypothetical protein
MWHIFTNPVKIPVRSQDRKVFCKVIWKGKEKVKAKKESAKKSLCRARYSCIFLEELCHVR